jgi:hypothetical protein
MFSLGLTGYKPQYRLQVAKAVPTRFLSVHGIEMAITWLGVERRMMMIQRRRILAVV